MRLARLEGAAMSKFERERAQPVNGMEALSQRIEEMNVAQSKINIDTRDNFKRLTESIQQSLTTTPSDVLSGLHPVTGSQATSVRSKEKQEHPFGGTRFDDIAPTFNFDTEADEPARESTSTPRPKIKAELYVSPIRKGKSIIVHAKRARSENLGKRTKVAQQKLREETARITGSLGRGSRRGKAQ